MDGIHDMGGREGFGPVLREADEIIVNEIKVAGLYRHTSQAFAVLLPVQSVGVMGDARTVICNLL